MKRVGLGLLLGATLGIFCIVGASLRTEGTVETYYLFSFWYNRVIIGLVIGLIPKDHLKGALIKGGLSGLVVSFAFYSSTNFEDVVGFIAGIIYGLIIAFLLNKFIDQPDAKI